MGLWIALVITAFLAVACLLTAFQVARSGAYADSASYVKSKRIESALLAFFTLFVLVAVAIGGALIHRAFT